MNELKLVSAKILKVIDRYSFVVLVQSIEAQMNVTISESMKVYENKTLNVGDKVTIQFSPFDLTKGRIHHYTFK